jgi:benzylsuccinate CoA-transferase BbsF subunit
MLSSCLNGQTGPEAPLAGFGTMGAALAGFGFLTGWPDRPPCAPFGAYTDYVSPRFALCAILAALDHRRRTGRGQHIDCAQIEASIHMITGATLDYQIRGQVPKAQGNAHPAYAPSGVYPVRGEDAWIAIAACDAASWDALCKLANCGWEGDARFSTAAARLEQREVLDLAVAGWTRDLEVDLLEASLQAAGIAAHRVSRSADLFEDPQLQARQHFIELEHRTLGPIALEASRMRLARTPARCRAPGPMIGEHNEEILKRILGLSDEEVTSFALSGALE